MRVSGGRYKGSPVGVKSPAPFLSGIAIRPTTSKIREWLFQIIDPYLPGSRFLDLFAGSGIVGIEALSRGSKFAAFVDSNSSALIRKNTGFIDEEIQWRIYKDDVLNYLRRRHPARYRYQIIFADPPYDYEQYPQLVKAVEKSPLLEQDGLFILEHSRHSSPATSLQQEVQLSVIREKQFGETKITIFRKGDQ